MMRAAFRSSRLRGFCGVPVTKRRTIARKAKAVDGRPEPSDVGCILNAFPRFQVGKDVKFRNMAILIQILDSPKRSLAIINSSSR